MSGPIETKVVAAAGGTTLGVTISGLVIYLLDELVYKTSDVPAPVVTAVVTVIPILLTFLAGYIAPHTHRPDLPEVDATPALRPAQHVADKDSRPRGENPTW
jgi:hypothetical protein